ESSEQTKAAAAAMELPKYKLEKAASGAIDDAERLALSDRVRQGEILAFVEIPAGALDMSGPPQTINYYAQGAMLSGDRGFVDRGLNEAIAAHRLSELNLDQAAVKRAMRPVRVAPLGLFKRAADGSARGADESAGMAAMFIPFGFMMLMFMVIM